MCFELRVRHKLTCLSADMIQAKGASHHPLGQLAYRIISGNTWYDSQSVLMDQKVSTLPSFLARLRHRMRDPYGSRHPSTRS